MGNDRQARRGGKGGERYKQHNEKLIMFFCLVPLVRGFLY